ncbi:tRNA pseudouridine(65) synthase TruC [Thiofilum flexile]|uniref:tRNA pseudouridine(65) synthase TruC n=1 Tax=Thiofilum flexile TaxID=125627 RepID=UPI000367E50C|nr:tRNA pseudouridine(65) synthase TruC [Thiofilum flexile]
MLEVIYQDDYVIAINKPEGLLVHRSPIDKHETRFALQLLRDQIGQKVYPVHRLDKPTSGVLLFALSSDIARKLTEQFTQGNISKQYLAIVRGHCAPHGVIDYPLQEQLDRLADALADPNKPAQEAITHYHTLAQTELPFAVGRYATARYSLVALKPLTGRKHQLRRHMKHIFHPILGDTTHGDGKHNQFIRQEFACQRLLLHAARLTLIHPYTEQPLVLNASLSDEFTQVLANMRLEHSGLWLGL